MAAGKLEQAQGVAHGGTTLPHRRRHLLVSHTIFFQQLLVGGGLLQGAQVLALDVLDQGLGEGGPVVGRPHHGRDLAQTYPLGRSPAPFTGDEGIAAVVESSHHHRLKNPHLTYRGGQLLQRVLVEVHPGLVGVGDDLLDPQSAELLVLVAARDQRLEAASQAGSPGGHPPPQSSPWRRRNSRASSR
jgi:hypothetical protein